MNKLEMLLKDLDLSKSLIIFTIILLIIVLYLILTSDASIFSDESVLPTPSSKIVKKVADKCTKAKMERKVASVKGYYINEMNEQMNTFNLNKEIKNIENLQLVNPISNKNEKMSNMLTEAIASLNSWKNDESENEIFKLTNWNLDKNEEDSIVSHYVYPNSKMNLSCSQSSMNSNIETEDGEDELNLYKLGICRTFNSEYIKSNIVKELHNGLYKIYSKGNPLKVKEICNKGTVPGNFDEIMNVYQREGYKVYGIAGKIMKMNYLQSQRIEKEKCESNMIFLGFVIHKVICDGYNIGYS